MLPEYELILVIMGFLTAFMLAFGIGANDVANSFGTSVGSKVLTLRTACILATIFEVSGAILLGGQVSATIRGGIIDPEQFNSTENGAMKLMYGQVASLGGSCIWMLIATILKIPVSGTHSIVGATAGFGLVLFGFDGIQWMGILKIVISWFASPLLSGFFSTSLFFIIKKTVLTKESPLEPALYVLPFLYGICIFINVFTVLYGGLHIFHVTEIPIWITVVVSLTVGILSGIIVFFCGRPIIRKLVLKRLERKRQHDLGELTEVKTERGNVIKRFSNLIINHLSRKKKSEKIQAMEVKGKPEEEDEEEEEEQEKEAEEERNETDLKPPGPDEGLNKIMADSAVLNENSPSMSVTIGTSTEECKNNTLTMSLATTNVEDVEMDPSTMSPAALAADRPEEGQVFSFAQILTATFGSFVHGGNDVSNAIGPLIGLWLVSTSGNVLNTSPPPIWILFYGGVGISVGLWIWGRKVMQTVGTDLTLMSPSSGMCIELGSATTVLIASKIGIPISTTHCLVGSVVFVGHFRSRAGVNWRLFVNIIIAWVVTLPISGGISALLMYTFTRTLPQTFG